MKTFRIILAHLLKKAAIGTPEDYAKAVSEQSDLFKVLKDREEHSRAIRDQSSLLKGLKDRKVSLGFRVEESIWEKGALPNSRVLKFRDADEFVKEFQDGVVVYRHEFGKVRLTFVNDYTLELQVGDDLLVRYRLLDTSKDLRELGLGG